MLDMPTLSHHPDFFWSQETPRDQLICLFMKMENIHRQFKEGEIDKKDYNHFMDFYLREMSELTWKLEPSKWT